MPAYIIVEIEILDPVGYEEYKKLAGATVEKYGGKYVGGDGIVRTQFARTSITHQATRRSERAPTRIAQAYQKRSR